MILLISDFVMYFTPILFILIELQSFGGNMYLNMGLYEFCGIFSNIFAFKFLKSENVRRSKI